MDRAADGVRLAAHAAGLVAIAASHTASHAGRAGQPDRLTIAAYAGVAEEPPTRPLLDALTALRVRVLLPVVTDGPAGDALDWAPYESWDALTTVRWGLLEPATERQGSDALATADLVVVPALAVDHAGHRLGRGRGFYDRALTNVDRDRRVAVVYASELVGTVPNEPHDEDVGWALTPDALTELDR